MQAETVAQGRSDMDQGRRGIKEERTTVATGAQMEMEQATATSIESLEQRVGHAVALIGDLRREREALRAEITTTATQSDALRREMERLREEHESLLAERGAIAQRIDDLVVRLEELDRT